MGRTPDMDADGLGADGGQPGVDEKWVRSATLQREKAIYAIAQPTPGSKPWPADVAAEIHAGRPGFKSPEARRATGFDEFLATLEKETVAFGKPVVYVHGDSHIFRVDKPFSGPQPAVSSQNQRGWRPSAPDPHGSGRVDPGDPQVLGFRQQIVKENLVHHRARTVRS